MGTINTAKGYTGQIQDAVTGLDYYNARYYDPVVGLFLSVDSVQGNQQGADPYSYTGGNPETMTDPTGQYYTDGSPYDRGYVESDPNGDGGHYILAYIPSNQAAPLLNDEWVNYTHVNKKGDVDVVAGWAANGRQQVQCAFGCKPNLFVIGVSIALDPEGDALVTVGLLIAAGILLVGIIANAVSSASSTTTAYNWVDKETADGQTVTVRKLSNSEVKRLRTDDGTPFEKEKQKIGAKSTDDIYVDDGDPPTYYIGRPGSPVIDFFP